VLLNRVVEMVSSVFKKVCKNNIYKNERYYKKIFSRKKL